MPWQIRYGRRYYYRTVRADGEIRTLYFGSGTTAELAESEDAALRQARQSAQAELAQATEALLPLAKQIEEFSRWTDVLLFATLWNNGFGLHHRQWRRTRRASRQRAEAGCAGDAHP